MLLSYSGRIKPYPITGFWQTWEIIIVISLWLLSAHSNKKLNPQSSTNKSSSRSCNSFSYRTGKLHRNNQLGDDCIRLSLHYSLGKVYKCRGLQFSSASRVLRHHHICLVCFFSHRHRANAGSQEERLTPPSLPPSFPPSPLSLKQETMAQPLSNALGGKKNIPWLA